MPRPLLALLLLASPALAADPPLRPASVARPVNADAARRALGLLPDYANVARLERVTVAVLDSGFEGVGPDRPYLPQSAVVVEHYDPEFVTRNNLGDPAYRKPFVPGNAHGRAMAQLAWAAAGNDPNGPRFLCLNANGPTLFRRAVRYAVEAKADVILFSSTFEGAGNGDGRGPVNAAVDEAVAAGILWVNAAGNCGGKVYNGPVDVGPGGFLRFPGGLTALRFRNRLDENAVTLTLTWNDYRDAEDAGTSKDLDLSVEDGRGRVLGEGKLPQVPAGRPAGDGETKNPRERLTVADLPASPAGEEYRIRVSARNPAAFGPRDRLRVLLSAAKDSPFTDPATSQSAPAVEFLDATVGGELYPPADHAGVLTVGDGGKASAVGPTADGRAKPDVVVGESVARFSNGEETAGSSNAAAYFAGVLAVLRATEPGLTTGHVRAWSNSERGLRNAEFKPPVPPPGVPLPAIRIPQFPLSPNQERAFRYAEAAADDQRARGLPAPGVYVTGPGGAYLIKPGGRRPESLAPGVIVPADPAARRDAPPPAWRTPSPRALAELVRGRP